MIRRPLSILALVGLLLLAAFARIAPAHPGHEEGERLPVSSGAKLSGAPTAERPAPGSAVAEPSRASHCARPSPYALLAGMLALLGALPRRRALALALAALLSTLALEGIGHAALHLSHLSHSDRLAIGGAAVPLVSTDSEPPEPEADDFVVLSRSPNPYETPPSDVLVAVYQGRAPPALPA